MDSKPCNWIVGCRAHTPGERAFATFEDAERFARKRFIAGHKGIPCRISLVTERHSSGLTQRQVAATIHDDALGRVWTDLESVGARLV